MRLPCLSDRDGADACAVRENGVILCDFGGDTSCPVWWQPPYLMLPLSADAFPDALPADVAVLSREVGCDSAAFVFLPVTRSLPLSLQRRIPKVVAARNGAVLSLPAGTWSFWYEGLPDRYNQPLRIVGLWEPREPVSDCQLQFEW